MKFISCAFLIVAFSVAILHAQPVWKPSGLESRWVYQFTSNSNGQIVAVILERPELTFRLFRSTDNGETWIDGGVFKNIPHFLAMDASGNVFSGDSDGGKTRSLLMQEEPFAEWKNIIPDSVSEAYSLEISPNGTLVTHFAKPLNVRYHTNDKGKTWSVTVFETEAFPLEGDHSDIHSFSKMGNESIRFMETGAAIFFKEKGFWEYPDSLKRYYISNTLFLSNNQFLAEAVHPVSSQFQSFLLYDGKNWTTIKPTGLPEFFHFHKIISDHEDRLWAHISGTFHSGIYYSVNLGQTWTKVISGLTNIGQENYDVQFLDILSNGEIAVGTSSGFYKLNPNVLTRTASEFKPVDFATISTYPNPFNGGTVITFSVPQNASFSLVLYNAIGQKVHTLIANAKGNGTPESFRFESKSLPSGIYFARLEAAGKVSSKKIMLLK